jgi:hypothetical protein
MQGLGSWEVSEPAPEISINTPSTYWFLWDQSAVLHIEKENTGNLWLWLYIIP